MSFNPNSVLLLGFAVVLVSGAAVSALIWLGRLRAAWASTGREPGPAAGGEPTRHSPYQPLVSIHVPISDEPPELVTATLDALAELDYPHFEVLVLDNNTSDPDLWCPVAEHCRALGRRFRFRHVERLAGYKAGALNLCLADAARDAELIFTVDADYRVEPEALGLAVAALEANGAAFVQLPQSYRHHRRYRHGATRTVAVATAAARSLETELGSFFSVILPAAGPAALPTGTLSLVRRSALEAVGGWPTRTVTEDAHLGVRLLREGYHGAYLHRHGGSGVLPHDLRGLASQRCRWVSGNVQTLVAALRPRGGASRLPLRLWPAVGLQLTAWWSLLPMAALGLLAAVLIPGVPTGWAMFCAVWVLAEIAATALFFHLGLSARPVRLRHRATLVRLALTRVSWSAGCTSLLPKSRRFVRTSKFAERVEGRGLAGLALAALFLVVAGAAQATAAPGLVIVALLTLAGVATLEPMLGLRLRRAARQRRPIGTTPIPEVAPSIEPVPLSGKQVA